MKIIALSGFKGSGKDAAANYLIENHNFIRIALADPLKDLVAQECGIPREHCDDPNYKEYPILHLPVIPKDPFSLELSKMLYKEFRTKSGRQVPEYLIDASGTFVGFINGFPAQLYHTPRSLCILKGSCNRFVRSDYWTQKAIELIESEIEDPGCNNKGAWNEGIVISDLRFKSEIEQLKQAFGKDLMLIRINRFDSINSIDPSENDLNDYKFDVIIENKGTLEDFYKKLDEVLK